MGVNKHLDERLAWCQRHDTALFLLNQYLLYTNTNTHTVHTQTGEKTSGLHSKYISLEKEKKMPRPPRVAGPNNMHSCRLIGGVNCTFLSCEGRLGKSKG